MTKLDRSKRIKLLEKAKAIATLEHNYIKALQMITTILEANPNDIDALTLRGNILDLDEQYDESLKCYKKALAIDERCVRAIIDMGDWYRNNGEVEKALNFYDQALSLLNKNIYYLSKDEELNDTYTDKVILLREQGRIDEAREVVSEALINCPGFEPPTLNPGPPKTGL